MFKLPSSASPFRSLIAIALIGWMSEVGAQDVIHTVPKPANFNGTWMGYAQARAGDINGDGFEDFIASTPPPLGGVSQASVYVLSGADGEILLTMNGKGKLGNQFKTSWYGGSVLGLGDVNFDGVPDIAVGADDFECYSPSSVPCGAVFVYSGANGSLLYEVRGTFNPGSTDMGRSLALMGDVDGDGAPDFATGGLSADPGGVINAGTIWVFSGATGAEIYRVHGPSMFYQLGADLDTISDLDGDGIREIVSTTRREQVRILSGADGSLIEEMDLGSDKGYYVASLDDLNGDGAEDFAIAMPDSHRVQAFSGADRSLIHSFDGMRLGSSVARVGDQDGDGVGEILAGAVYEKNDLEGRGIATLFSGASGAELFRLDAQTPFQSSFGFAVGAIGDLDGDGREELLITERLGDGNSGKIHVYAGLQDCNDNGLEDRLEVAAGTVQDLDGNQIPDLCEESFIAGTYCASKVTSGGCVPILNGWGTPPSSGVGPFAFVASDLPANVTGLLFYGFGQANIPFQGGTLCVQPPLARTPVAFAQGVDTCDGSFVRSLSWLDSDLISGAVAVQAQVWFRDVGDLFGVGLTNGFELTLLP